MFVLSLRGTMRTDQTNCIELGNCCRERVAGDFAPHVRKVAKSGREGVSMVGDVRGSG